ncbi:SURF1 family protein [Frondihabitans australicus]|uniref:SURF1-like protein n=1 Tax=Frondihabitans australicus TaxID=386892 RepID=A0A495II63_9MICO|nr:SURF1 family protein [Frondihabitans australicus]RKR75459.1 cytochrome oxidase assembly protein ShyY1 [Frondihabitans australicus]
MTETRPSDLLPETMWEVARRPKWIAMLVFALLVAALFAYLGHWQLDRSVESLKPAHTATETRVPLADVQKPQTEFLDKFTGQKVSLSGSFSASDFTILSDRLQHSESGYWLVDRFQYDRTNASVVVALGWSKTRAEAKAAISSVPTSPTTISIGGRYLPTEAADDGKFQQGLLTVISVPQLINRWSDVSGDVYNGYVVADRTWGGMTAIYSPKPIDKATLNWLNIFYAVEWVVFAGFAIFLWYRLVKDDFERIHEEADEAALAAASATP